MDQYVRMAIWAVKMNAAQSANIAGHMFKLTRASSALVCLCLFALMGGGFHAEPPISCVAETNLMNMNRDFLTSLCYIRGTHTTRRMAHEVTNFTWTIGKQVPDLNLGPGSQFDPETIVHRYYHWVAFILVLQALSFYGPHVLWKKKEGALIQSMTVPFRGFLMMEETLSLPVDQLVCFMRVMSGRYTTYMAWYYFCSFLAVLNPAIQFGALYMFLGKDFLTYGYDTIQYALHHVQYSPGKTIFPTMTKCSYAYFAPSGNLQRMETLCVLAQNALIEKIYLVIWFWLLFHSAVNIIFLVYEICSILSPWRRSSLVQVTWQGTKEIRKYLRELPLSDWFVLRRVRDNVAPMIFTELVYRLTAAAAEETDGGSSQNSSNSDI